MEKRETVHTNDKVTILMTSYRDHAEQNTTG